MYNIRIVDPDDEGRCRTARRSPSRDVPRECDRSGVFLRSMVDCLPRFRGGGIRRHRAIDTYAPRGLFLPGRGHQSSSWAGAAVETDEGYRDARASGWLRSIVSDTTDNIASANNFIKAGYELYAPDVPWAWPKRSTGGNACSGRSRPVVFHRAEWLVCPGGDGPSRVLPLRIGGGPA